MVKTKREFTHHEMEMMVQATAYAFLKKDVFVFAITNLFLEPVRLQSLLFGDSFTQISLENFASNTCSGRLLFLSNTAVSRCFLRQQFALLKPFVRGF